MRRLYVFLGLALLIFLLHQAFPFVLQDEDSRMRALYLVLLLCLFAGGRRLRGRPFPKAARDAALWIAILLLLVMGYSFRDELGGNRLMAELSPSHVRTNGDGSLSIKASEGGHFFADGEVNGAPVRFLVDTGASGIVLSPDDARRAGIDTENLAYDRYAMTANGAGAGAEVTLGTLEVGSITLRGVSASVNKAWMKESLLGMSFLRRLHGFRVEGDRLVLVP